MKPCLSCGAQPPDDACFCTACGRSLSIDVAPSVVPRRLGDDDAMRLLLPVGRSAWAIAAGYLGLFAVLVLPAPLALICGILAIRDIRRTPGSHGLGRAWFGVIMGGLFSALGILFVILYFVGRS